jgi:hypothetical protein
MLIAGMINGDALLLSVPAESAVNCQIELALELTSSDVEYSPVQVSQTKKS